MATIASPRPHSPAATSNSSRRTSLDTVPHSSASSPARNPSISGGSIQQQQQQQQQQTPATRRHRAALRDYYNLKPSSPTRTNTANSISSITSTTTTGSNTHLPSILEPASATHDQNEEQHNPPRTPHHAPSPLDDPAFSAPAYITTLLQTSSLSQLLNTEAQLLADIRGLDGERKALVYDNYSKLISATETIGRMRANMDPLRPTTSTLSPAVAHISGLAAELAAKGVVAGGDVLGNVEGEKVKILVDGEKGGADQKEKKKKDEEQDDDEEEKGQKTDTNTKEVQRQTVLWVLAAPRRLQGLVEAGRRDDAEKDWEEIKDLLHRWEGVRGVEEVRKGCLKAMELNTKAADQATT